MKLKILLFSLVFAVLVALGVVLGYALLSANKTLKAANTPSPKPTPAVNVLFALRGIATDSSHISLDELSQRYCEGKVYVLAAVKPLADSIFQCQNSRVLSNLKEFAQLAKTEILITDLEHLHNRYQALTFPKIR